MSNRRTNNLAARGNENHVRTSGYGQVRQDAMFGSTNTISYKGPPVIPGIRNKEPARPKLPPPSFLGLQRRESDYLSRQLKFDLSRVIVGVPDSPNWRDGMPVIVYKDNGMRGDVQTLAEVNVAFPLPDFIRFFNAEPNTAEFDRRPEEFINVCCDPETKIIKYRTVSQFLFEWTLVGTLNMASVTVPSKNYPGFSSGTSIPKLRSLIPVRVCGRNNTPAVWEGYQTKAKVFPGEGIPCGIFVYWKGETKTTNMFTSSNQSKNFRMYIKPCSLDVAEKEAICTLNDLITAYKKTIGSSSSSEARTLRRKCSDMAFIPICTPVASSGDFFPIDPRTGDIATMIPEYRGMKKSSYIYQEKVSDEISSLEERMFSTVFVEGGGHIIPMGKII